MKLRYAVAALVGLVLLYPLSFGPVMGWAARNPQHFMKTMDFYRPLRSIPPLRGPLDGYFEFCAPHGFRWVLNPAPGKPPGPPVSDGN